MRSPVYFRSPSREVGTPQKEDANYVENERENIGSNNVHRGTHPATRRTGWQVSVGISYSSTILLIWALFLAFLSGRAGFHMQAGTILTLCTVALTSEHGESRLLMPLIFLSERCLDVSMNSGHSAIEFYSATVLSYLSLVAARELRQGKSPQARNVVAETVLYAVVALSGIFFIVKDKVISLGSVAYVASGHVLFLQLLPILGENEAVLVSSIAGFYLCDVFINNNLSVDGGRDSILHLKAPGYLTSYTHIASRGMMLGAIYIATLVAVLSRLCLVPVNKNSKSSERRVSRKRITIIFWVSVLSVLLVLLFVVSWQFRANAIVWLYGYITASRFRLYTLGVWAVCIPVAVILVDVCTRSLKQTVRRKLFHFIAVLVFTPAAIVDPSFMAFALSSATSLCMVVETGRYFRVHGTETISRFVARHIDHRDNLDGVVRTHMYLIFGMGVSMILRYRHQLGLQRPDPFIMEISINIIPGIISLGIVDAWAAIIGSSFMLSSRRALGRYLKNKIFTERANTSIAHKTTTGTIGGLICGMLFWLFVLIVAGVPISLPALYTFTMVMVCTVTECFMDGVDNLQLPLVVLGAVNSLFALIILIDELWENPVVAAPSNFTARIAYSTAQSTP